MWLPIGNYANIVSIMLTGEVIMRCMECGREMQFTTAPMTETYRGERITVEGIEHYICECGNDEMSSAEATKLARALATQYAKAHELLSPSDIK